MLLTLLLTASPQLNLPIPWAAHPPREALDTILSHLYTHQFPTDAVYVTYGATPTVAHYQRLGRAPATAVLQEDWPAGRIEYQASRALAVGVGHPRLWVVMAHALPGEEEALAHALTRRGAYLVERVTAPGAVALLWEIGAIAGG